MKKNKLMRLASGLLVGTLLTTCAISGTFAKYTTQDSANDSARVAKWGISLQIMGNLYSDQYENDLPDEYTQTDTSDAIGVRADQEGTDVVAPGTKSDDKAFTIKLSGTPEVDYKYTGKITTDNVFLKAGTYANLVKIDAEVKADTFVDLLDNDRIFIEADGGYKEITAYQPATNYYTLEDYSKIDNDYYPVVYKTTNDDDGTIATDSLTEVAKTLADLFNGNKAATDSKANPWESEFVINSINYHTNQPVIADLNNQTITWAWTFEQDTANKEGNAACQTCLADTILGNLQAGDAADGIIVLLTEVSGQVATAELPVADTHYNLDTQFTIDVTVTQID